MRTGDILGEIREFVLSTYSQTAQQNNSLKRLRVDDVKKFINQLQDSLYKNDPTRLIPSFDHWLSQTDYPQNEVLLNDINNIFVCVSSCSQERLSSEHANQLIAELLPIFVFTNQHIYNYVLANTLQQASVEQSSLEKLDKSKSDFISIAAHELKTPLTLLEGYSSMLREILEQKKIFDDHIFQLLDGMNSGSRRLREIINDMIDVSLIDNELLSLNFQPTWLFKILAKIQQQYQPVVTARGMSLDVKRFDSDDLVNYYDAERIYQAIANVVSNAIKYTPDEGHIMVDGRKVDGFSEIMVIDSGIGIDPENQVKIFNKLHPIEDVTVHSSGKTKFKGGGPGLGLPIAKGIVEAHGGRIWVESTGRDELKCPGSIFHILLPITSEPPDQEAEILFKPLLTRKQAPQN
jgi:signal transduction histidine kinase